MQVRDAVGGRLPRGDEVVEGDRAVNGAAIAIHTAVHAARPDVLAAVLDRSAALRERLGLALPA